MYSLIDLPGHCQDSCFRGWILFWPWASPGHWRKTVRRDPNPQPHLSYSLTLISLDFWTLPDSRLTHALTERVEGAFYNRCPPESRPTFLSEDGGKSSAPRTRESVESKISRTSSKESQGRQTEAEKDGAETTAGLSSDGPRTRPDDKSKGKEDGPKYDSSLPKALHSVLWVQFWFAGLLKLVSGGFPVTLSTAGLLKPHFPLKDTLNTTTPLVNQVLLTWLTNSYIYFRANDEERTALGLQKPQGIGYGIGLAFAIFVMQGG